MLRIFSTVVLGLLLASAAAGETISIYKYRQADGRVIYSNRPLSGATLLEQFEYQLPAPASIEGDREQSRLGAEQRIAKHLAALEAAWNEVQDARQALARAEGRLRTEVEPTADEPRQLVGPADVAPPAAGGPQPTAPPAAGGPQAPVPPAVGGPMGARHGGGGRSPEYQERLAALEADVKAAQERLNAALRRYNALR